MKPTKPLVPIQQRPPLFWLPRPPGVKPTLIDRLCRTLRPWAR